MMESTEKPLFESRGSGPAQGCRFQCVAHDQDIVIEVLYPGGNITSISLNLLERPPPITESALITVEFMNCAISAGVEHGAYEFLASAANIVIRTLPATASRHEVYATLEKFIEATGVLLDAAKLQNALALWMQWLVLPAPAFAGVKSLPDLETYFEHLVKAFLQSSHSNHQKFCLAIFRASVDRLDKDLDVEALQYTQAKKGQYSKAFSDYCHLFEIIVMGRYVNQIQECLTFLPSSRTGKQSVIKDVWWLLLFRAALESNNEQIRKIIGTWLLDSYIISPSSKGSIQLVQTAFLDSFLTWMTNGQLAYKSIIRDGRTVRSEHGELLSAFYARQSQQNRTLVEFTLKWLSNHVDTLNQHTTVYSLRELSRMEASLEMSQNAAHIADGVSFGPLARLITRRYCLRIMENFASSAGRPSQSCLKEIDLLRSRVERSYDLLDGEIGPFLLSSNYGIRTKEYASAVLDQLVSNNYIEKQGNNLVVDWDRIIRYDPRQALWKLFAESWAYWVEGMLQNGLPIEDVTDFVADCISNFFRLSRRKPFIWSATAKALRWMYLNQLPALLQNPRVENAILSFINDPPSPTPEYLLDVAVAVGEVDENGCQLYDVYADEPHGHAAVFDILNRLRPEDQTWGLEILDKLLDPWQKQQEPIPVASKWKRTSQLQAMIILLRSCNSSDEDMRKYRGIFSDLLAKDPNPRIRFLFEWVLLDLGLRSSTDDYTAEALNALEIADPSNPNPKLVASQIKIAVQLVLRQRPRGQPQQIQQLERLLIILAGLIGSPRIPIRFEAQASFPILFDFAKQENLVDAMNCSPVFQSIYNFVIGLDKYKAQPEARILGAFSINTDMNMATLFEGGYLYIPQAELPLLCARDVQEIINKDTPDLAKKRPPSHLPIGSLNPLSEPLIAKLKSTTVTKLSTYVSEVSSGVATVPLQTKSLVADLSSLSLTGVSATPQGTQSTGPILIGTLLEAPVNLGGLSRAANVFGCHSLHVPDINILQNGQFKTVSVNSELHIDVRETKATSLVEQLREFKGQGWMIVGLEQTSDSRVIGVPGDESSGKKLPKKAVIVMGAESTGIPADVLFECDTCIEIKQWGVTRSLNVQTAAACILFEWRREWGDGVAS